eukprot:1871067-Amphidinium_carterae.1
MLLAFLFDAISLLHSPRRSMLLAFLFDAISVASPMVMPASSVSSADSGLSALPAVLYSSPAPA